MDAPSKVSERRARHQPTTSSNPELSESIDPSDCPSEIPIAALLARHAQAYGSPGDVASALPLSITGTLTHGNAVGKVELFVEDGGYRRALRIGPAHVDEGIDNKGAWHIDLPDVLSRLNGFEATGMNATQWILRRAYITEPDFVARCETHDGRAVVYLALGGRDDIGRPELAFDWASAALLQATHFDVLGAQTQTKFLSWHEPSSAGIRWPKQTQEISGASNVLTMDLKNPHPGLKGTDCRGRACLDPRATRVSMKLGKDDNIVTLPFTFYENEILLKVKIAGHTVDALLDSGAGLTVVDATSNAGKAFVSGLEIGGEGTTQKIRAGLGEIAEMHAGDLAIMHMPAASVPVPLLVDFGARRPELILGWTLFEAFVIRIDYAKSKMIVSRSVSSSDAENTNIEWIPLINANVAAVEAEIEEHKGLVAVDTGNAGVLSLSAQWNREHGLPGERPSVEQKALTGAGTKATVNQWIRLRRLNIGPLAMEGPLVTADERPSGKSVAFLGNGALATCQAIVFDVAHRRLGLEGPCNRRLRVNHAGWRLVYDDAQGTSKKAPWVIRGITHGGSAEQAGVVDGDRLLAIAGRPATIDRVVIDKATSRPLGTKLTLLVDRNGTRKSLVMKLRALLPALPSRR
ncbi:MAG: hypothetical protein H6729_12195 [Deltaproteobacteria bacterium]|nr:hypothetical protein [Deltaproteobacteria bacterium]